MSQIAGEPKAARCGVIVPETTDLSPDGSSVDSMAAHGLCGR